ncbi:kinase-like domain-containing protein [Phlyctochytrium arcticum]|nr:kinase-like domain-containing protein [Phlyctochytrium arcticum]
MEDSTQSMTAVPLDEKHLDKSAFWGRLQPLTGLEPILMRDGADRYILNTDANPNAITEYFDTPKHGLSFYRKDGLVHLFNHDHYETSVNSSFIKIGHECILQHGDEIGTRKDHDSPLFRYIFQLDDLLAGAFERQILMSPENGTYVLETELGRGAFSTVRLGVHKESGKKYAVKLLHAEIPYGSAGEESLGAEGAKSADLARVASDVFAREIELMGQVCHDNIVQLYEHFSEASQAVMVLEYMGGGDLHDYVALQGHLSESVARDYFAQMVGAIEHLHGKMIVHRDLKPENFLLDMRRKRVKLSDFGVAKIVGNSSSNTIYGTPYYLAPEVLESNPALPHKYNNDDFAVDMYSLGAILFFMLTGDVPSLTNIHLHCDPASRDDHSAVPSKTSISSSACHTILELTRPNPRLRMSLALLLVDPWLSDEAFALPHTRPAWGSLSRQNPVERIPLIKNGLVLGRSKTADITICDPRVSGRYVK